MGRLLRSLLSVLLNPLFLGSLLLPVQGCDTGSTTSEGEASARESGADPFFVKGRQEHMDTTWQVTVHTDPREEDRAKRVIDDVFREVGRIEAQMSTWREDSELSRLNAASGGGPVPVSPELFALLERTLAVCERTEGALDITFHPLARLWDLDREPFQPPSEQDLAAAAALVDWGAVKLDPSSRTVRLEREGMSLGLGAVAKGYAVDRAVEILEEAGFDNVLVNGGGDVRALGGRGNGPWRVGIQHPRQERGELYGRVMLRDGALVTSGDYERYVEWEGRRYHHILDPRTGRPARRVRSATVHAETAELADALSTAFFVAGVEGAAALRSTWPEVEVLLIRSDGSRWMTGGFPLEGKGARTPTPCPAPAPAPSPSPRFDPEPVRPQER